jgi:hypothetical protein
MEWININDRLPERFQEVIMCSDEGKVKSAVHMGDGKFNTFLQVVYWQPMPKAPEMNNKEIDEPVKKRRGRPKKV